MPRAFKSSGSYEGRRSYNQRRRRGDSEMVEDDEDELPVPLFETKEERLEFVRKVYFILTLMLLVDVGIICCALFIPGARAFFQRHLIIYILSYIFFFIIYITLVCCRVVRHKFPYNYIMVALLAISMGFMLACIASFHSIDELLIAAAGTMLVTLAVTLIALCGTFDITGYGFYLVIASLVLMVCGLVIFLVCFFGYCGDYGRIIKLSLCSVFVLLFSMYLLYDTQMILGGGRVRLSQNEYILGAIQLWIDIANIFLCLLKIVGQSQ